MYILVNDENRFQKHLVKSIINRYGRYSLTENDSKNISKNIAYIIFHINN